MNISTEHFGCQMFSISCHLPEFFIGVLLLQKCTKKFDMTKKRSRWILKHIKIFLFPQRYLSFAIAAVVCASLAKIRQYRISLHWKRWKQFFIFSFRISGKFESDIGNIKFTREPGINSSKNVSSLDLIQDCDKLVAYCAWRVFDNITMYRNIY